ncbi:MAG: hypothetical protein JXR48_04495 [Candidatus Delongbacteria bacterium]|nr:hypothetical protein [Candidatus Delongbacteria bacterium]MBN2834207.1 hypothetical protein [Candidatus Delongbacteria bacterium]
MEKLYEDENIIAFLKPNGVEFHKNQNCKSFVDLIRDENKVENLYPVHRLDKETSGIILFAKNSQSARLLSDIISIGKIDKFYIAVSRMKPKKSMGFVKGDIVKSRSGSYKLSQSMENPSSTIFVSKKIADKYFFLVKILTGKTHQIRVVMKSLGSPILGDTIYGNDLANRMYLHSCRSSFQYEDKVIDIVNLPHEFSCEMYNIFCDLLLKMKEHFTKYFIIQNP